MNKLNNNWTLWLHLPQDVDWSISSYRKVFTFDTLEESISLIENINKELVEKCMLFIMKNNIKPIQEDPDNRNGGCLSYKINTDYVYEVWKKLSYYLIGGSLTDNEDIINNINGISISPKKNFCIIKLWVKDTAIIKTHDIFACLENLDLCFCIGAQKKSRRQVRSATNRTLVLDVLSDVFRDQIV